MEAAGVVGGDARVAITYRILLLRGPDDPMPTEVGEVTGPFAPRIGDVLVIPIEGADAVVGTVTGVILRLDPTPGGGMEHVRTIVEVLHNPDMRFVDP